MRRKGESKRGRGGTGKQTKRGALNQEAKKRARRACGQKWLAYLVKRNWGKGREVPGLERFRVGVKVRSMGFLRVQCSDFCFNQSVCVCVYTHY